MDIRVEEAEGTATAHISGEADADNCHLIGQRLLDGTLGKSGDVRQLELDLGQLDFIDSSAISELLRVRTELQDQSIELTIVNPSDAARRVLEITGLLELFGITE